MEIKLSVVTFLWVKSAKDVYYLFDSKLYIILRKIERYQYNSLLKQ